MMISIERELSHYTKTTLIELEKNYEALSEYRSQCGNKKYC